MELAEAFERAGQEGRAVFIPYVTGGYPTIDECLKVLKVLADEGADIMEVGIPFSDPIADGATIQEAVNVALRNGTTPADVLNMVKKLKNQYDTPILVLTYLNIVLRSGVDRFADHTKSSGVEGLIIPDLPLEESGPIAEMLKRKGLALILLAAPTTSEQRLAKILDTSHCFTYLVSVTGVTGERKEIPYTALELVKRAKNLRPDAKVAVGFGVSTPEHGRILAKAGADGVIIGSRIISLIKEGNSENLRNFSKLFKASLQK